MTYYVVVYRWSKKVVLRGRSDWMFADQRAVENSYESYPVMYLTRERAEKVAAEFRAEGMTSEGNCETKVVPVEIKFPEGE